MVHTGASQCRIRLCDGRRFGDLQGNLRHGSPVDLHGREQQATDQGSAPAAAGQPRLGRKIRYRIRAQWG